MSEGSSQYRLKKNIGAEQNYIFSTIGKFNISKFTPIYNQRKILLLC